MSWQRRELDRTRRAASPLEVDLIEALADGSISRRDFLRRGAILGVSGSVLASVIAACGGQAENAVPESSATPQPQREGSQSVPEPTTPPRPASTPAPVDAVEVVESRRPPTKEAVDLGGALRVGVQFGDVNTGLDPVNMFDIGTYSVVSQSFEYLVGLAPDGFVGPTGLATSWSPNVDGTAWTFNLRPGIVWHDGLPLTSADVVATVDRMAVAGAGLFNIVSFGAGEAIDDLTVVISLDRPVGNFPVLMSIFNAQSVITPVDYSDGTTLDVRPNGTGPWRLIDHDPTTFTSVFAANAQYWGGRPNLDEITLIGFESQRGQGVAFDAEEVDVLQSINVFDGFDLLDDSDVTVLSPPSANHRQVWFNTQLPVGAPFTDARVRRAVAHCVDRQQVVDEVYRGRAIIANDHAIHPTLPFFDADAVPQRRRDTDLARQLLAEAGLDGVDVTIEVGDIAYSPDLATVLRDNCAEAGIRLEVNITRNSDFYGAQWCPGASFGSQPDTRAATIPCGASGQMGIVDYGHRPIPEVFLGRSLVTDSDWNSANFASAEFDASFAAYDSAVDVESQRRALGDVQRLLHDETPVLIPAFFDYMAAHRASLSGIQATSLGHLKLDRAQWL